MTAHATWLGHATTLISFAQKQILIDPLGRKRTHNLGPIDTILITHSHIDHLNRWTLATLNKAARLIVPKGARDIVSSLGFTEILEAEPGDHFDCDGIDIIAVETRHDAGRWRRGDAPICVGYLLQKDGITIHHAGDVDMSTYDVFDTIGKQFAIDATLLPIGGLLPPWYYRNRRHRLDRGIHICPETALHIAQRLSARIMIPVHWGTLNLRLFHRATKPRDMLIQAATSQNTSELVHVLGHGETLAFRARGGSGANHQTQSQHKLAP